jgi:hypothetical protein
VELLNNMSLNEARAQARDRAALNALENAFGTSIIQGVQVRVQDNVGTRDAGAQRYFNLIADSYVQGEWVETLSEEFEVTTETAVGARQPSVWVKCKLSGTARRITEPRPQLDAEALNCPSANCATARFIDGDALYLSVRSPVDGYLQVYLEDGDAVLGLLPYQQMPEGMHEAFPMVAEKEYIFFSTRPEHNYFTNPGFQEDELQLSAEGPQTYHRIYLVFSTHPLTKPYLRAARASQRGYTLPRQMSRTDFHQWIAQMKTLGDAFYVQTLDITVAQPTRSGR